MELPRRNTRGIPVAAASGDLSGMPRGLRRSVLRARPGFSGAKHGPRTAADFDAPAGAREHRLVHARAP